MVEILKYFQILGQHWEDIIFFNILKVLQALNIA